MLPEEAQRVVLESVTPGLPELRPLDEARGRALAEPILASEDLPAFAQSAMDGYALAAPGGAPAGMRFKLAGLSRAGGEMPPALKLGEAVRIFTGAPVPAGATLIAIQEISEISGEWIIPKSDVPEGLYLRPAGSDIKAGAEALAAGTWLGPAALSLLKGLGLAEVSVHRAPRVSLVASGDELCLSPAEKKPGQVMESSSIGIRAALRHEGLSLHSMHHARDEKKSHVRVLREALEQCEVLLITGGVSVGDYDLARPALQELGVETIFWRVRQRPGGPLYFGKKGHRLVFGLPGNPASTLVCFYQHVLPALRKSVGRSDVRLPRIPAALEHDFRKPAGKVHFVRARVRPSASGLSVRLDAQQESHTLRSFAESNALAVLSAELEFVPEGALIHCDLLPGAFA